MSRSSNRREKYGHNQRSRSLSSPGAPDAMIGTGPMKWKLESVIRCSMAALPFADFGNKIDTSVWKDSLKKGYNGQRTGKNWGPGRPEKDDYDQQTGVLVDPYISPFVGNWERTPPIVRRQTFPNLSFENLQLSTIDPYRAMRSLPRLSSIVAHSARLTRRMANTPLVVNVLNQDSNGAWTVPDKEAIAYLEGLYQRAGTQVICQIPGAVSSQKQFVDDIITQGHTWGACCQELVLKRNKKDYSHLIAVDPTTIEFHRDKDHIGAHLIGQRRTDVEYGWLQVNPNLVTYRALNGTGLGNPYGEPDNLTAFHVAPIWQGYFGKLAIYIQRAAFGFLDGVVKVEILQQMWQIVPPDVRQYFLNDFMVWSNAMVAFLAKSYKDMGEADPDALLAHLDLLEIKGEASGKASFPTTDAAEVVRTELYIAEGAPGELFGAKSSPGDRFTDIKIEAYRRVLEHYRETCLELIDRAGTAAIAARGWPRKILVKCHFMPMEMYDMLTLWQAKQIEGLVQKFYRDEGLITQNDMSQALVGRPAIAQHPMASGTDLDGDSTPDPALTNPQPEEPNPDDNGSGPGSSPSAGGSAKSGKPANRGGNDKVGNRQPMKDKRMSDSALDQLRAVLELHQSMRKP